jgi:dihydroorotate dehydrogenase
MCAQHVADMLQAGADVVQSATGMMWHPLLAREFHQLMQQQPTPAAAAAAAAKTAAAAGPSVGAKVAGES